MILLKGSESAQSRMP